MKLSVSRLDASGGSDGQQQSPAAVSVRSCQSPETAAPAPRPCRTTSPIAVCACPSAGGGTGSASSGGAARYTPRPGPEPGAAARSPAGSCSVRPSGSSIEWGSLPPPRATSWVCFVPSAPLSSIGDRPEPGGRWPVAESAERGGKSHGQDRHFLPVLFSPQVLDGLS